MCVSSFFTPLRGCVVLADTYITNSTHRKTTFFRKVRHLRPSSYVGVSVLLRMLAPPPRRERAGPRFVLALLTRLESRNTTMTVMSSWKWRRTPRSIFLRSEYLISLFLAAACSAALINFLAQPWKIKYSMNHPQMMQLSFHLAVSYLHIFKLSSVWLKALCTCSELFLQ